MTRKLSLRKEALTELGTDELASVAGGQQSLYPTCACTGYYPSIFDDCRTLPTGLTNEACA